MRGLDGKTAIVTGAASGIGKAIAGRLGEEGCKTIAKQKWGVNELNLNKNFIGPKGCIAL